MEVCDHFVTKTLVEIVSGPCVDVSSFIIDNPVLL